MRGNLAELCVGSFVILLQELEYRSESERLRHLEVAVAMYVHLTAVIPADSKWIQLCQLTELILPFLVRRCYSARNPPLRNFEEDARRRLRALAFICSRVLIEYRMLTNTTWSIGTACIAFAS